MVANADAVDRLQDPVVFFDREREFSAYRLMQELFPDLPATETFPGMSEPIGHLHLLEDEDRDDITEREDVKRRTLS